MQPKPPWKYTSVEKVKTRGRVLEARQTTEDWARKPRTKDPRSRRSVEEAESDQEEDGIIRML